MLHFIRNPDDRSEDKDFTIHDLEVSANVSYEQLGNNLRAASARPNATWLQTVEAHDGMAIIAAGGPSLANDLAFMKLCHTSGETLFAVNNVPKFLMEKGIIPDAHILLDSLPSMTEFVHPEISMVRFYSSQCDPAVHDLAPNCILWNPYIEGLWDAFPDLKPPFVGGGTTIGTRAIGLAYQLGYRRFRIFGLDCSMAGDELHAYSQPHEYNILEVTCGGKSFRAPMQMMAQAEEFMHVAHKLLAEGCELHIYGDGLLRAVADEMFADYQKQMN